MKHSASFYWGCPPKPPARIFFGPCRSRRRGLFSPCPRTPKGLPFLVRRKGSKRLFRGCPPKDPQGERSGRVPLNPHGREPLRYDITYQEPIGALPLPENFCALLDFLRIVQLPGKLFCLFQVRTVWKPRSITSPYFALTWQGVGHARGLTAQCLPWWIPERATRSAALCARLRRALFRKCAGISEPVDPHRPSVGT